MRIVPLRLGRGLGRLGHARAARGPLAVGPRLAAAAMVVLMLPLPMLALLVLALLMLSMVLVRLRRRRLRGGRGGDRQRDRGHEIFHCLSPLDFGSMDRDRQESRGGGGSASG
jgi:hypothetical protein